jgi:hypothetical protein
MAHDAVWFSRPRGYGKGARAWYVYSHRHLFDGEY